MEVLSYDDWRAAQADHRRRVDALAAGHLARREHGIKHPVEDFLWVYYQYRPGRLRAWHPGPGVLLEGASAANLGRFHAEDGRGAWLDVPADLAVRGETVAFVADLVSRTTARPAQLACFGLHEWAMVYGLPDGARRHEQLPLRLSAEAVDEVVRSSTLRCSHHDALRFFTPQALPRNTLAPTRATQAEFEQPGCLHATMDLYKWCFKLAPGIPSALTLDCFELARRARELDMRASPYDVSSFGLTPVEVETADGRAEYVTLQRDIMARGSVLRARLLQACAALLG